MDRTPRTKKDLSLLLKVCGEFDDVTSAGKVSVDLVSWLRISINLITEIDWVLWNLLSLAAASFMRWLSSEEWIRRVRWWYFNAADRSRRVIRVTHEFPMLVSVASSSPVVDNACLSHLSVLQSLGQAIKRLAGVFCHRNFGVSVNHWRRRSPSRQEYANNCYCSFCSRLLQFILHSLLGGCAGENTR